MVGEKVRQDRTMRSCRYGHRGRDESDGTLLTELVTWRGLAATNGAPLAGLGYAPRISWGLGLGVGPEFYSGLR